MITPTRMMLIVAAVAAVIAVCGGFLLGRSAGGERAPGLPVRSVERIDRPAVGPPIPVPAPLEIPARLPR
jgi:hypothetical protein